MGCQVDIEPLLVVRNMASVCCEARQTARVAFFLGLPPRATHLHGLRATWLGSRPPAIPGWRAWQSS